MSREEIQVRSYTVFDPKTAKRLGEVTAKGERQAQKIAMRRWNCSLFAIHVILTEQLSDADPSHE